MNQLIPLFALSVSADTGHSLITPQRDWFYARRPPEQEMDPPKTSRTSLLLVLRRRRGRLLRQRAAFVVVLPTPATSWSQTRSHQVSS